MVGVAGSWLVSQSRVAVAGTRGGFGNPEERVCPSLEAVTRRLVKTVTGCISV
jgi:hypothetical protein